MEKLRKLWTPPTIEPTLSVSVPVTEYALSCFAVIHTYFIAIPTRYHTHVQANYIQAPVYRYDQEEPQKQVPTETLVFSFGVTPA